MSNFFSKFKSQLSLIGLIAILYGIVKLFSFSENNNEISFPLYKTSGVNLPQEITLAGEAVPIKKFNVREALDKELTINTYWQSQTLMLFKIANRWFPVIEPILKRNQVPDDFKYIVLAESGLTNIVSPAGAAGYWQLMESTAKAYGLEINSEVDERYNLEKSTEVACKYFNEAYRKLNNWTLVAASYNMGIAGIQRQLDKQKVNSYYDLLLNEETARYVYRVLAIKELFTHPKDYGYALRKKDFYPPILTDKIIADTTIMDLASFALSKGINYKILKYFNPWLRKNKLSNSMRKIYLINIPKKDNIFYDEEFAEVTYTDSSQLKLTITTDTVAKDIVHLVKKGETISSIAKQYHVEEEMIKVWNRLDETVELKTDQEIIIFKK